MEDKKDLLENEVLEETNLEVEESAVSEEVSANVQQVSELSNDNVEQLREAVRRVNAIRDTIMELEKYQD